MNQNGLAGLGMCFLKQSTIAGRIRRPNAGSPFKTHILGQTPEIYLFAQGVFGVCAADRIGCINAVADLPFGHVVADSLDNA